MNEYRIDASDRAWFKLCRRAWDLGARARSNYEPADPASPLSIIDAVGEALAVYYFPGMWEWDRTIVLPLVHQALDRAAPDTLPASHDLLDRYARWAAERDAFVPLRVAADLEVNVPDPLLTDRDLTADEAPVRYTTRADAVVWTTDDQLRLLCHRIGFGPFADPEVLALDEPALTTCWAWAHLMLDDRIGAILFNEVRLDREDAFRRTEVPLTPESIAIAGRQLGTEVLDMLDAGVSVYPNPTPAGCGVCGFRPPCRAQRDGLDPAPILAARYRPRPEPILQEGRLGGQTWSTNRGARPPRFEG